MSTISNIIIHSEVFFITAGSSSLGFHVEALIYLIGKEYFKCARTTS